MGNDSMDNYLQTLSALSSAAIEGNRLAIELLELREKDVDEFIRRCVELGFMKKEGEYG